MRAAQIDWSERDNYIAVNHDTNPTQANEAATDANARILNPDPKSITGISIRIIGYSTTAAQILTVILVPKDSNDPAAGYWGANCWPSNSTDRALYRKGK